MNSARLSWRVIASESARLRTRRQNASRKRAFNAFKKLGPDISNDAPISKTRLHRPEPRLARTTHLRPKQPILLHKAVHKAAAGTAALPKWLCAWVCCAGAGGRTVHPVSDPRHFAIQQMRALGLVATLAHPPASAQSVDLPSDFPAHPACAAPAHLTRLAYPLEQTAKRVAARGPITIVAIGSSSTAGAGASSVAMNYPSRLAVELNRLLPHLSITVLNRGVNGQEISQMLARQPEDVIGKILS